MVYPGYACTTYFPGTPSVPPMGLDRYGFQLGNLVIYLDVRKFFGHLIAHTIALRMGYSYGLVVSSSSFVAEDGLQALTRNILYMRLCPVARFFSVFTFSSKRASNHPHLLPGREPRWPRACPTRILVCGACEGRTCSSREVYVHTNWSRSANGA